MNGVAGVKRNCRWTAVLAFAAAVQTGCFPPSWGAAALLHPWRNPLKTSRPATAQDITINSDGVQLKGWFFRGPAPRRGTVIYLHGIADNRASGVSLKKLSAVQWQSIFKSPGFVGIGEV